ncbi:hypothetical protein M2454_000358 [Aequitasia blattaphilus]|uniref:Glycosyltransferase RgtA/B/C/D-like domain-containing protein n=1 Tax=Aequitasia blattaphilus TaxID=2949332 RepID=A0ABT1E5Z3_9FIRM|nr:hypothetical protein [Aequitasia blattaphilus]MCP1101250.1 hypothetical protein [Aequitasia blattaphilus]MCR8613890.1 hypothetical protein [Aequitasia blattaphilus]
MKTNSMKTQNISYKKVALFLGVVVFNLIISIIFLRLREPYYATVDDTRMRDIVSGAMTGTPDPHVIFLQYPLGVILSTLYKGLPTVPWYLISIIGNVIICVSIVLYKAIKKCGNIKEYTYVIFFYLLVYLLFFKRMIIFPQFTTTSGVLSSTAIILYATTDWTKKVKDNLFSLLAIYYCILFGFMYRTLVFYMMIPLFVIIIFIKNKPNIKNKRTWFVNLTILVVVSASLISIRLVDKSNYQEEEYKTYREFNILRSQINDYYKMPDYYENKEFFDEINLDYIQWQTIKNYSLALGDDISIEKMKKVVDYQKEDFDRNLKGELKRAVFGVISSYQKFSTFKWQPFFLVIIAILFIILFAYKRRWTQFLHLGAATSMVIFGSLYFIFIMRFPQRIAETLWCPLVLFSLLYILDIKVNTKRKYGSSYIVQSCIYLGVIGLASFCIYRNEMADREQYEYIVEASNDYTYMIKYSRENKENFYYYYVYSFADASDKLYVENEDELLSFTSLGGWLTRSPLLQEKYKKYGFSSTNNALFEHENVYIAITAFQDIQFLEEYLWNYYPDKEWVVDKTINDGRILLLRAENKGK